MSFWTGTHWEPDAPAPPPRPRPSRRRHALEALAEGLMVSLLIVGLAAGTTFAAKGGSKGSHTGAASAGSSIALDQAGQQFTLGTKVTFTTSVAGLTGNEYPLVYLKCTEGDSVVYGQLDLPDTTFVLGGGSSPWWQVGGTATCVGYLEAYGTHAGSDTIRVLAQTDPFTAN